MAKDTEIQILDLERSGIKIDLGKILEETGKLGVKNVQKRTPVRTGEYKDNISYQEIKSNGDEVKEVDIFVDNGDWRRAHLLEFGTRYSDAQPHFRPAFDETEPEFRNKIANETEIKIKKKKYDKI